jgi:hypothetical protein
MVLAPTWDMVNEYKKTKDAWTYTMKYYATIIKRIYSEPNMNKSAFDSIVIGKDKIMLVCFCPAGEFCHRILAARLLENMGYGTYVGEITT